MTPNITILGLDHSLQQNDPTGDLRNTLLPVLVKSRADLVGEEAHLIPSTVAQQIAKELGKPWLNIDMNTEERIQAGIYDELSSRPWGPIFEDGNPVGMTGYYLPHADGVREEHWVSQILRPSLSSAVVLCGVLHLVPVAERFRQRGCVVDEINVCAQGWYKDRFGTFQIFESGGKRWYELRNCGLES